MNTKFNIDACGFPGFYESIFLNGDTEYYEAENIQQDMDDNHPGFEVTVDDLDCDYNGYENAVGEAWVTAYASLMPEGMLKSFKFSKIVPPRNTGYGPDYRFGTDKIYFDVELCDDWLDRMAKFIKENEDWFADRIHDDWSSRDGFMSFMGNTIDEWMDGLREEDERYIGTTLYYMIAKDNPDFTDEINEDVYENVYFSEYASLTKEKQEAYEEFCKKEEEEAKIREYDEKHQLKIEFPE